MQGHDATATARTQVHPQVRTVLHLSDPQFGRHHPQAQGGTEADRAHDTLVARLIQDLEGIEDEGAPVRPDLVVVTGDLSEWARPSELRAFETFAAALLDGLQLPRERLVIVPGNHDVSWAECEAHFKQCEAREIEPQAPYWPKWRTYAELFSQLYGGPRARFEFNEARPYTLYVHEDLQTVVAGLNSTMLETHREGEHFGTVGEDQLRWFGEQLARYRAQGWLRIAAVHHNVQRRAVDDDENLRDADLLERLLGPHVNLVLHGHTHDGKMGRFASGVPILGTGSAAVDRVARPHGVPRQYQLVRVHPGGLRRYTRMYQEAQRRWVADTAASDDGNAWIHDHPMAFVDLHGVFPQPHDDHVDEVEEAPRLDPRRTYRTAATLDDGGEARTDDFLHHLAEIFRLREPHTEVTRRRRGPPVLEYLELCRRQGDQIELVPVGGREAGLEPDVLEAFVQRVVSPYRARDPGVRPVFVYGGPPAPAPLVERARAAGVWLRSYEQHCGLIDFRRYRAQLAERLARDPVYPSDKYVGQRMVERIGSEEQRSEDALATVRSWLDDEHGRFVLVLGTFGCGKTFLLRELARRLASEEGAVVPILVEMRSLEKGLRLEQLLAQHFALHEVDDYSPARFLRMLADGRVVLLFDGFDELVVRSTYARAAEHFDTIVSAARGRAKVVVTSRRQHFLSDHQAKEAVRQVLLQKVEAVPGHRVVTLLPFEPDQIETFLAWHLGDVEAARERMRLIEEVRDLSGLSSNPRMLGFIAALSEPELRAARDQQGAVSAASLYRGLLDRWLAFEQDRRHPRGAPPGLSIEARWQAVTDLAVRLWTRGEHHVGVEELEALGEVLVALAKGSREEAGFQIGSGTLLVRDEEGRFSFIHESVLEWLVAKAAADALAQDETPALLGQGKMSQLLVDFFIDLAQPQRAEQWSTRALVANLGNATADNALMVRQRLVAAGLVAEASDASRVDLTQQELRGRDLSGQMLAGATLSGADLSRANLRGTVLVGAQLDGARLTGADLSRADLRDANLQGADLSEASLLGARLEGADLRGATLRRTKLIGATLDDGALDHASTYGAALPHHRPRPQCTTGLHGVQALALDAAAQLLVLGDRSVIRVWDVERDLEIAHWPADGDVVALAFDPQRAALVTGDHTGIVTRWDLHDAPLAEPLVDHDARIVFIAVETDGRALSISETAVHVSDSAFLRGSGGALRSAVRCEQTGRVALGYEGGAIALVTRSFEPVGRHPAAHAIDVVALAFAPNGRLLASGDAAGTMKLWTMPDAVEIARADHPRAVTAIAWVDPDHLVTTARDGKLRVWSASGVLLETLEEHPAPITTLTIADPWIVSASVAGGLRARRMRGLGFETLTGQTSIEVETRPRLGPSTPLGAPRRLGVRAMSAVVDGGLSVAVDDRLVSITPTQRVTAPLLPLPAEGHVTISRDGLGLAILEDNLLTAHRFFPFEGRHPVSFERRLPDSPTVICFAGRGSGQLLYATTGERSDIRSLRVAETEYHDTRGVEHRGTVGRAVALASSADGRYVAIACADHAIYVISPLSQEAMAPPAVLTGHRHAILSLELAQLDDGPHVISGSVDGTVIVWDVLAGKPRHTFSGLPDSATAVASSTGSLVAAGDLDGNVHVWHAKTGDLVAFTHAHDGPVTAMSFPAHGQLATASRDGTVRLWRLPSLRPLATLASLAEGWLAFAPDGRYKTGGRVAGQMWHTASLCRFEVGELDEHIAGLRLQPDDPLADPA